MYESIHLKKTSLSIENQCRARFCKSGQTILCVDLQVVRVAVQSISVS